ncbi:MAG: DUF2752 domain-containing protein [Polyangiaceae bacterium]|nr:DUF2752 domain-containing protein [Polyangiaceae bacterium]
MPAPDDPRERRPAEPNGAVGEVDDVRPLSALPGRGALGAEAARAAVGAPAWAALAPMAVRAGQLGGVAALIGVALALGAPGCPIAFFLRVPCPGCGLTRATLRLLHGDFSGALAFHPLVPLVLPLALAFAGTNALAYVVRGRWGYVDGLRGRALTGVAGVLVALMVSVWVARFFGAFGGPVPV